MSTIDEITGTQGQMRQALSQGLDVIDLNQTVTFTRYRRLVLPADGFVFWVKDDIISPSALVNSTVLNRAPLNQPALLTPASSFEAQGSLHHTTVNTQAEAESSSTNRMIFTSKTPVDDLADIEPETMYLARLENGTRYAFSSRSMWYKQAALYHYSGDAVYPALATQIIDTPYELRQKDVVVSNSLPVWLTLNSLFPVYPSWLVPDNKLPPYAAVHIGEEDTTPMQSGATHDRSGSRWQLAKDVVRVTTYGVRNADILDWMDMVNDYTLANPTVMGVMNSPMVADAKRGQVEISTIAQKKVVTFHASYYQARIRDLARQLILNATLDRFLVPADVGLITQGA